MSVCLCGNNPILYTYKCTASIRALVNFHGVSKGVLWYAGLQSMHAQTVVFVRVSYA